MAPTAWSGGCELTGVKCLEQFLTRFNNYWLLLGSIDTGWVPYILSYGLGGELHCCFDPVKLDSQL